MNTSMMRALALLLVLVPCMLLAQDRAKQQSDRAKVLDVAATTPFFTKKGADAVKRVIAGGDAHKADEKALDGPDPLRPAAPQQSAGAKPTDGPQPQAQPPQAPQPAPEPTFAWRLVGISYGKRHGMALFQADGHAVTVQNGMTLDSETKVVSISKWRVVVDFHGKRLELTPW